MKSRIGPTENKQTVARESGGGMAERGEWKREVQASGNGMREAEGRKVQEGPSHNGGTRRGTTQTQLHCGEPPTMWMGLQSLPVSSATSGLTRLIEKREKESEAWRSHLAFVKSPCPLLQILTGSRLTLKLCFGKGGVVTRREPSVSGEARCGGPSPADGARGGGAPVCALFS